ncbi:MAG: hypothetical protein H6839_11165 [Planctomycetes bacterium]|nr:hypothetical protein [Planctomycetota bacterium]
MGRILFPEKVIDDNEDAVLNRDSVVHYSKQLQALNEPNIADQLRETGIDEYFRISLIPTFTPVVLLRAWRIGKNLSGVLKISVGPGGYDALGLRSESAFKLPSATWRTLSTFRDSIDLWSPTSLVKIGPDGREYMACDGHTWLVEYVDRQWYRAMAEHCPESPTWLKFEEEAVKLMTDCGVNPWSLECDDE